MPQLAANAAMGGLVGALTVIAAPSLGLKLEDYFSLPVVGALLLILMVQLLLSGRQSAPKLPADAAPVTLTGDDKKDFVAICNALNKELCDDIAKYNLPPRTAEYMERLIEYNVPKGKLTRGLTVIQAYKSIKGVKSLSEVDYRRAATLGWTVEWLQAMFLVLDDIMDESETRRGQPCWYLQPDVKMNAINDGLLLEGHIYVILKKYFSSEEVYLPLIELLHEVTYQTALGQFLDLTTSEPDKVDFDRFSLRIYSDIVIYKTAFYSFYLPCALGMRLAGVTDPTLYAKAKEICMDIGHLFQVQDDYLDCYGHPDKIGKIGTDIKDNKCGWLINTALQTCSPAQKRVLTANYAKKDPKCEAKVKEVFKALDIESKFRQHEEEAYAKLKKQISEVKGMPTTIFTFLLEKIYKRDK